jgi:hypothetical protein
MVLFESWRAGSFTLQYSRNGGPWQNYKTVEFTSMQGRTRTYCVKLVRANEYQFRIVSSEGNFKLLEYKIDVSASPEDK